MISKKLSSIFIISAAVALMVVLAFHVRTGVTANSVVYLNTDGMTCGSCAVKITTSLESLKGVAATEVYLESGLVTVGYDTKNIRPEALAEQVSAAGFSSRVAAVVTAEQFKKVTGRAIGQVTNESGGLYGGRGCCSTYQAK